MQGETGSLRDLKRYRNQTHSPLIPKRIPENNCEEENTDTDGEDNEISDQNGSEEHMARLREFQVKLLASSHTAYNKRARSGRRHTLCLTR